MSLVIAAQVGLQATNSEVGNEYIRYEKKEDDVPLILKYVPGLGNALLIIIFGTVY